jgi:hypothetical protein
VRTTLKRTHAPRLARATSTICLPPRGNGLPSSRPLKRMTCPRRAMRGWICSLSPARTRSRTVAVVVGIVSLT